ncbi:hypothetical protein YH64_009440 [Achromobacter sp. LC458]|uniref:hypothetical protein n=1 Tax=Achromobacter sp. LC458 TaxID=1120623 RepID=UPI00062A021B|nr:hypothetical protein [Achromobacter sp. LC458]TRM53312.1 hypothetical protein YH64_009440 [Achromobacter sp. LC458]
MTENNAAQPGLTDAAIQALWDEACKDSPQSPGWNRHIRFARALLSKLRAEGVQAGDERAALQRIVDTAKDGANSGDRHARCVEIARAALASAPVAMIDTAKLAQLLDSVNGDCYLGKEKEEDLVQSLRSQLRARVAEPEWIDDPHDIEQGMMRNPKYVAPGHKPVDTSSGHSAPVADERISLLGAANLAFNALHECKPAKGAEKQYSDAIQALQSALHDIAYTVNRTATPQQFADHLQREARAALASASVADESPMAKVAEALREKARQEQQAYQDRRAQATEWGPMPTGTQADDPSELGALADGLASAPVAGEARSLAILRFERGTPGRENDMPRVVACDWMPDGEYPVYAAPQASEAVRNRALEEAAALCEAKAIDTPRVNETASIVRGALLMQAERIRALKTQADKDGGDCAKDAVIDLEAAAKALSECMDYPWTQMPEKGRAHMREHAQTVINAALAAQKHPRTDGGGRG